MHTYQVSTPSNNIATGSKYIYNIVLTIHVIAIIYLFSSGVEPVTVSGGEGRILFGEVSCLGIEDHILDCSTVDALFSCTHAQDVGVRCFPGKLRFSLYYC